MFTVIVDLQVRPDRVEEFLEGIHDQRPRLPARRAGCLRFDVHRDTEDPHRFLLYEIYADAGRLLRRPPQRAALRRLARGRRPMRRAEGGHVNTFATPAFPADIPENPTAYQPRDGAEPMTRPSQIHSLDSFGTRAVLAVAGDVVPDPQPRRPGHRRTSIQPARGPGEPAASRGRAPRHRRPGPAPARLGCRPGPRPGRSTSARHGRSCTTPTASPPLVDLAAMRCAMVELGEDPALVNPQIPAELVIDHSRHRRRVRHPRRVRHERRDRVRPQRRALPVPQVGTADPRGLRRRPAGHRDHAPGQRRVPRPRRHRRGGLGLPRHLPGHRLPHHHGQRPRRPRLGDRRHRGRGRHARRVAVDAAAPRRRVPAARRAPRGRHRHRPRPHHHRDAAPARRGRQVRRVLRPRGRGHHAPRPADHRQHEPRVRLHLRLLPDRRRDPALPAVHRPPRADRRPRRGLRQAPGPLARPDHAPRTPSSSSSTWPPSCPRWPGPADPRTGSCSPTRSSPSATALPDILGLDPADDGVESRTDEASAESFPASDPPALDDDVPEPADAPSRAAACHGDLPGQAANNRST